MTVMFSCNVIFSSVNSNVFANMEKCDGVMFRNDIALSAMKRSKSSTFRVFSSDNICNDAPVRNGSQLEVMVISNE